METEQRETGAHQDLTELGLEWVEFLPPNQRSSRKNESGDSGKSERKSHRMTQHVVAWLERSPLGTQMR